VEPKPEHGRNVDEVIRMRLQLETALLGWVRTSLALMGFGFVLARFGFFLREVANMDRIHLKSRPWLAMTNSLVGTVLILLGVIVLLVAFYSHRSMVINLERGDLGPPGRWSLGMVLCLIMAAIGMGMAIYLSTVEI
jgi:putative membrane protein